MEQILKDIKLDAKLQADGYVKLKILSDSAINALADLYEETRSLHENTPEKNLFHATQDSANVELTKYVDKKAKEILLPFIKEHFTNYQLIMANFIVKEPGNDSELKPHQDWSFVDEPKYFSYGFWTPVEPTNEINGNMLFLPGSHKIMKTLRVNYNYPWAYQEVSDKISELCVEEQTEFGESILLNHSVIHGSRPNLSGRTRVALSMGMTHKNAQLLHHYCEDAKTVEKYKINLEILEKLKSGVKPENIAPFEIQDYEFPIMTDEKFDNWVTEQKKSGAL